MNSLAGKLGAIALVCVAAGCATGASYVPAKPIEAVVINRTGGAIASIHYQECGTIGWRELTIQPIPSGMRTQFQLPADCINLQALGEDGRIVGTQNGVRREYPLTWTIS